MRGRFSPGLTRAVLLLVAYFAAYVAASTWIEPWIARPLVHALRPFFPPSQAGQVPPAVLLALCVTRLLLILPISWAIARADGRRLRDMGWRPFPPRQLLHGGVCGLLAISAVVAVLMLTGRLTFTGLNTRGVEALAFGVVWLLGMLLVGLSEEAAFRGVPVFLLADRVPPGLVMLISGVAFAAVHAGNGGETILGLTQVMLFGMVTALSVLRTRSLAWAIGVHAGWNWTLEYLYGAIGSGYTFQGHLLRQTIDGPEWLTGGSSGLEGSVLASAVWIVVGCMLWKRATPRR